MKKIFKKNYVAVDIHGVLADFEQRFVEKFGNRHREYYNFYDRYPKLKSEIDEFMASPWSYKDIYPIFGGIRLVNELRSKGLGIILLSSCPDFAQEITRNWLNDYLISYDQVVFVPAEEKATYISNFNMMAPVHQKIVALVDDCTNNFLFLPDGVVGITWEQPWNEGYFPRARFNDDKFIVEAKTDTVSEWIPFWRMKK